MSTTTVKIRVKTHEELDEIRRKLRKKLGRIKISFDEVISYLIDFYKRYEGKEDD